jgi:hypothetical protein
MLKDKIEKKLIKNDKKKTNLCQLKLTYEIHDSSLKIEITHKKIKIKYET